MQDQLKEELGRLQADNSGLLHRIAREREIREAAQGDRARLETELELDSVPPRTVSGVAWPAAVATTAAARHRARAIGSTSASFSL